MKFKEQKDLIKNSLFAIKYFRVNKKTLVKLYHNNQCLNG